MKTETNGMRVEVNGYAITDLRQEIMKIFLCQAEPDDMSVAIMELLVTDLENARLMEQTESKRNDWMVRGN